MIGMDSFTDCLNQQHCNGASSRRRKKYSVDSKIQETYSASQEAINQANALSQWKRIMLLVIAITVHNIPEGLAVGVSFGAIGNSDSATFEAARWVDHCHWSDPVQFSNKGPFLGIWPLALGYKISRRVWQWAYHFMRPVSVCFEHFGMVNCLAWLNLFSVFWGQLLWLSLQQYCHMRCHLLPALWSTLLPMIYCQKRIPGNRLTN